MTRYRCCDSPSWQEFREFKAKIGVDLHAYRFRIEKLEEIIKKMNEVKDDYPMPFGKHKGKRIGDVPASYLNWISEQSWSHEWPEVEKYINKNWDAIEKELHGDDKDPLKCSGECPSQWRHR